MHFIKQFTILLLLASCAGTSNKEQSSESPIDTLLSEMEVTPIQVEESKPVELPITSQHLLANTTFIFTTDFDLGNCESLRRCDCCTFEAFFIDSVNYYIADYCEASTFYTKGTYKIDGTEIFMRSWVNAQIDIEDEMLGSEADTSFNTYYGESYFTVDSCNSELMLISSPDPPASYGIRTQQPFQELTPELRVFLDSKLQSAQSSSVLFTSSEIGNLKLSELKFDKLKDQISEVFPGYVIEKEIGQQDGPDFLYYSVLDQKEELFHIRLDGHDSTRIDEVWITSPRIQNQSGIGVGKKFTELKESTSNIKLYADLHYNVYAYEPSESNIYYRLKIGTFKVLNDSMMIASDYSVKEWQIDNPEIEFIILRNKSF